MLRVGRRRTVRSGMNKKGETQGGGGPSKGTCCGGGWSPLKRDKDWKKP